VVVIQTMLNGLDKSGCNPNNTRFLAISGYTANNTQNF